jgi:hypothetical protein
VIWARSFDDQVGGAIALHNLCARLNENGERASIWPSTYPFLQWPLQPRNSLRAIRYGWIARTSYTTGPFNNPIATRADLREGILLYPEIVVGNPLRARRVARWFLHRPGYHMGKTDYGPDELYFFYQEAFNDPSINPDPSNRLTLNWVNPVYRDEQRADRAGSCFLVRKGVGRAFVHPAGAIPIDDLSHPEKASVFNRTKYLYSYDLYSLYNVYAALCGCIPIVVPDPALPKEQWLPREEDRWGLAYGEEEIPWAVATRRSMIDRGEALYEEERQMVLRFAAKCHAKFG